MPRGKADALTRALGLLKARERTVAELRAALEARAYAGEEIDAALSRLQALGYLDDARVAEARARRGLSAGRSRRDVAARLAQSGLDEAAAVRALATAADEVGHDELAAARRLVAKRRLSGVAAVRFLLGRGYEEDVALRAAGVDALRGPADEGER